MSEEIKNLWEKANQLMKLRKWNELIQVATELINLENEPHHKAMAYCTRGSAYSNKDEYDRAIENFTKAIELNPNM